MRTTKHKQLNSGKTSPLNRSNSTSSSHPVGLNANILQMQKTMGNQYVLQMLRNHAPVAQMGKFSLVSLFNRLSRFGKNSTLNQSMINTSYNVYNQRGELNVDPEVNHAPLPGNVGGHWDADTNEITINQNHDRRIDDSTIEHERAHAAHDHAGMDIFNDPDSLLLSELAAKQRGVLAFIRSNKNLVQPILEGRKYQDLNIEHEPLELRNMLYETSLYREDPKRYAQVVLSKYAKEYQPRFLEVNLAKRAKQLADLYYMRKE